MNKRNQTQHTSIRIPSSLRKDIEKLKSEGVIPHKNSYRFLIQLGFEARIKEYSERHITPIDVPHVIDSMLEKISDIADRLSAIEADLALKVDDVIGSQNRGHVIIDGLVKMICEIGIVARDLVKDEHRAGYSRLDERRQAQVKMFYDYVKNKIEAQQRMGEHVT